MQAFVRDPDGYYIEFCDCDGVEVYLRDMMKKNSQQKSNVSSLMATNKFSKTLMRKAQDSKKSVEELRTKGRKVNQYFSTFMYTRSL